MRSWTLSRNDHWSWSIVKNLIKCWLLISHIFFCPHLCIDLRKRGASLGAQMVKNPPAMWETWVRSLCWEDPLKEGMATPSSILVWKVPGQRSLVGYSPRGLNESDPTVPERSHTSVTSLEWERVSCPSPISTTSAWWVLLGQGTVSWAPPPQGERRVFYPFCDNSGSWTVS